MRAFVSSDQMSRLDQATMQVLGISSFALMEKVSDEMVELFRQQWAFPQNILVLCGPGNNGGDGYRVAEKLRRAGHEVSCWEILAAQSPDCRRAKKLFKGRFVKGIPAGTGIVMDAIFGYRGRSELPKSMVKILATVNRAKLVRIALDVATGTDPDSGAAHPDSFQADLSYCVGFPKFGFLNEENASFQGRIFYIGKSFFSTPTHSSFFDLEEADFQMQRASLKSFKSDFGRCGIVGGSSSMPGAAVLAAEAAHRVGAGYVELFFAENRAINLRVKDASFLWHAKWKAADLQKMNSLVLGCGGISKKLSVSKIFTSARCRRLRA